MELNGAPADMSYPVSFTTIQRTFADGDTITLHLPMTVKIQNWANGTASVERGPLVYSLKIDEQNTKMIEMTPDPDFPACNKRPASPWNYSLPAKEAQG